MHALIIDDSRTMRTIVGKILKQIGFRTTEAVDGLDGLQQIKNGERPDLVLVDWNMPQMCGLDFVRSVRAIPEHSTLRVVMVTSETDSQYVSQALEAGANEYIMKPFTADVIKIKLSLLGFEFPADESMAPGALS